MASRCLVPILLFVAFVTGAAADPTKVDDGFRQMYNLEFEGAHRTFQAWQQTHPEDPLGPVADAAAYLFSELDRLHILQAEYFETDRKFLAHHKLAPDPEVKRKFEAALDHGQQLADRILSRSPQHQGANFATILRLGLHSDYLALIERSYLRSLSETKSARILAQKVVAKDPQCYDAYLAIGVENYLLSLKAAPVRWALHLGGAQTDKAQGLQNLRITAEKGCYLRPFARLLLAVAALRDNDRAMARELLRGLAGDFPHNPLYAQELSRLNN